jgi:hypothetical protein
VRFVQDQHRFRLEVAEPSDQPIAGCGVGQQPAGDKKAAAGLPWIGGVAMLPPRGGRVVAVDDGDAETEASLHHLLPLDKHARRGRNHAGLRPATQQQTAQDQAGLDGLPEADIVGDELVHARHQQRFA